jgi:uncharacterized protein
MTWEVAKAAIDQLFAVHDSSAPLTVGFLGGEPFVNRALIGRAVEYAAVIAGRLDRQIGFSVTTNGTLLKARDIALLQRHRFAVTVSIDGGEAVQNSQRPLHGRRRNGFAVLSQAIAPLLAEPGLAQIAARATVLPATLDIPGRFNEILRLGFQEVGFAPLKSAPNASAFEDRHWPEYFESLTAVARAEFDRALRGDTIRLTNLAIALKQLHRGASSPYPCGAGGGYFSVGASGEWYACHRAIGDPTYHLGNSRGLDVERREIFLRARHVHAQTDCNQCWARYLCSGGCHHEAAARTTASCDFIRAWLNFCLACYCELSVARPGYFGNIPHAAVEEAV